jgi:archaellum component FlaG (FlaF/FlaG flagellin family)
MKKLIYCLMLAFCAINAMAQRTFDTPEILYKDGKEYQCFTSENLQVIISYENGVPLRGFDKNPSITILVQNNGTSAILVDPSKITAKYVNGNKQKDIEVYSQKQLASKVDNKIKWFGPNDTQNVQVTSKVQNKNQYGVVTSTTEGTATTKVYTGEGTEERTSSADYIEKMYLKKNTVMPNENTLGIVVTDKVKKGTLYINVTIGDDLFVSSFNVE